MIEVWAVDYRENGIDKVNVFDNEKAARTFANFPENGVKILSKPWEL